MNLKYAVKSEDTEQIQVMNWAHWYTKQYPELKWLHHIPNGGSRNRAEAVKLQQMGVKAGVADLFLPSPKGIYCGLYIELKYGDNRKTARQKEFLADMAANGYFAVTCYSADEAVRVLEEYVTLPHGFVRDDVREYVGLSMGGPIDGCTMSIPNNGILKDGKLKPGGR